MLPTYLSLCEDVYPVIKKIEFQFPLAMKIWKSGMTSQQMLNVQMTL